jgi:uncharacterized MAPEG superfamily protein
MRHRNPSTEKISNTFERFNAYAVEALKGGDDADVYASLAVAFEISQLRYFLSTMKPKGGT